MSFVVITAYLYATTQYIIKKRRGRKLLIGITYNTKEEKHSVKIEELE